MQEYYEKHGFVDAFGESPCWIYAGKCTGTPVIPSGSENNLRAAEMYASDTGLEELGGWSVADADAKAYKAVRDEAFEKEGYVEWDEQAVAYALKENQFCTGRTLLLTKTVRIRMCGGLC